MGIYSLIVYDGQTFDRIIPLLAPNYSYVSKEGKVYFSSSMVTSIKYGDTFFEETEEGLVQKIYLGD